MKYYTIHNNTDYKFSFNIKDNNLNVWHVLRDVIYLHRYVIKYKTSGVSTIINKSNPTATNQTTTYSIVLRLMKR
jgi:hypothetical protein